MLFLSRYFNILTWKIPNGTDWQNWVAYFTTKYEKIYGKIVEEYGTDGLAVLALLAIFLFLICIIYIKAIIDAFRPDQPQDQLDEFLAEIDEQTAAELEAEKELSLNLIAASAESDDILGVHEDYERLKEVMQQHAQEQHDQTKTVADLAKKTQISPEQTRLRELASIIVKMLARQVTDYKIAQTIANRLKPSLNWEDILQTIRMLHNFIGLANSQVFAQLPKAEKLPNPADALRILCEKGDNSLCLELLQNLTSQYIDDAMPESGITRHVLLAQASGYACLTGNFAWFDDLDLAQTSFNFATEISAENVNAWSRLGDVYVAQNNLTKAMFAYQSVIELGEEHLYDQQLANARFRLASYYRSQGMSEKALEYTDKALEYYNKCGLSEPLTTIEDAAADLIISRQDISESIEILIHPQP